MVFETTGKEDHHEWFESDCLTDKSGRFSLSIMHSPFDEKLRLSATKAGYQPYSVELMASEVHKMLEKDHELIVVLERESPS